MFDNKEGCELDLYFMDWETDGLNGPVQEFAVVKSDGTISVAIRNRRIDLATCMPILPENSLYVFWHTWHVIYLRQFYPALLSELKGRYVTFADIGFYLTGTRSIQKITKRLTGMDHKGNAVDDSLDLYRCWKNGVQLLNGKASIC